MGPNMIDNVKFEKEKAIARFNRFQKIVKLWQIFEFLMVFGMISWSTAHVPAVLRVLGGYFVEFSSYMLNHHVVFLIGNAIIVLLFMLCRQNQNEAENLSNDDLYNDYTKHSVAAHQEIALPPEVDMEQESAVEGGVGNEEKQIVVVTEELIPLCDDVAMAIQKAKMQINKFQRSQSDKLKREIGVRSRPKLRQSDIVSSSEQLAAIDDKANKQIKKFLRTQSAKPKLEIAVRSRPELRRSETENYRFIESSKERRDKVEIETLSNEEFQRTCEAYITGSKRKNMIR